MLIYLSITAALLYVICPFISDSRRVVALVLTACAWCLHGLVLGLSLYAEHALRIGFAVVWSAAIWVSVLVYLVENRNFSLDGLRILVLPQAAVTVLLPIAFPGSLVMLSSKPSMFPWHVGVALLAYSTLTIAAFHALAMYVQDLYLHRRRAKPVQTWLERALDRLPALLKMEHILFLLVTLGFILLSLTVLSGVIFSEQFLGVAFKWDHKTVLSLLSWLLFAVLLAGRQWRGWRGKAVLRITLFGFVSLLLAYVGSRFVLEVVLHRSVL
ncbi:cytochrome C assembly family protein [Undibacterium fentianense]|uniref:Cytochrome c biogenesis protein CcsA n=1 Tax=Undibacterium fentianense TaxID=2828728 RepID=A0A941IFY0_9BURK|nr:cytochrome c biogenesis protein CcsA [Undibacterium fentianense]MBR7799470.1 cytochrome c biogenesis protein CcsA [Undibacterium fentianense]